MRLCVLLRDVISSQKLAFLAGHCGKINLLLKVSKLVIIVTEWLFKTLPCPDYCLFQYFMIPPEAFLRP